MHFKHTDGAEYPAGFDPLAGYITLKDGTTVQVLNEGGELDEVATREEADKVQAPKS